MGNSHEPAEQRRDGESDPQAISVDERELPMAQWMSKVDWTRHPFGPRDHWPRDLQSAIRLMLDAAFPAAMWLGPDLRLFYNDAYRPILGPRHPSALGQPGREVWGELWEIIGPQFEQVISSGKGIAVTDQMLPMTRFGYVEETWWNYSFSPLTADNGVVSGVLNEAHEVTAVRRRQRHDSLVVALDEKLARPGATDEAIDAALEVIGRNLSARRVGYAEVDVAGARIEIRRCWDAGDMPDIRGHYPLGTFGAISEELKVGQTVVIVDNLTDARTADPATVARYAAISLRAGIVVPIVQERQYVAGVFVQDDQPRAWTPSDVALVEAASTRLWSAIERRRSDARLRDSEERYRLIFEQVDDIIFATDLDQVVTDCNLAGAAALGLSREAIIGRPCADFVSPAQFAIMVEKLNHKLQHGGTTRHEVELTTPQGRQLRWEIASSLRIDRDGRVVGLHVVAREVTERRAFDERRELLINELNHRVKNTLSLVQALARQSLGGAVSLPDAEAAFLDRLGSLALAHDLLTRDQWEGVTLAELARAATRPAAGDDVRVLLSGPDLLLSPKVAVSMTMALHELTTNAVKYGALSRSEGQVKIEWASRDGTFLLKWCESGGPVVIEPAKKGFGIRMVERVLASDLNGKVKVAFLPEGLQCRIEAPLAAMGDN